MQTYKNISPSSVEPLAEPVLDSIALARLVEEVRQEACGQAPPMAIYNRTYHRHNR